MAIYQFLNNKAINSAKKYLEKCKRIILNGNWQYSQAFISAYDGVSHLEVYWQYEKAFETDQDLLNLTVFI